MRSEQKGQLGNAVPLQKSLCSPETGSLFRCMHADLYGVY
jgi:hypothetical protein